MALIKNMMVMAGMMALACAACGERILSADLDVYMNDSVVLHTLRMEEGYPTKYIRPGDYELAIVDGSGNTLYKLPVKLDHTLFTDPPRNMDPAPLGLRIAYDSGMKRLTLSKNGREIYSKEIDLCDNDGACDMAYETSISCPADCRLDGIDGMCIKSGDGNCDPDCINGADPDCKDLPGVSAVMPYLIAAVFLLLAAAYASRKKRKKALLQAPKSFE